MRREGEVDDKVAEIFNTLTCSLQLSNSVCLRIQVPPLHVYQFLLPWIHQHR